MYSTIDPRMMLPNFCPYRNPVDDNDETDMVVGMVPMKQIPWPMRIQMMDG
jgi:hypothetical protein